MDVTTNPIPPEKLAVLWTEAQPAVSAYLYALLRDFHDTQDVLQLTAEAAFINRSSYDTTRPFRPWALGLARIEALRFKQKQGREKLVFDSDVIEKLTKAAEKQTLPSAELQTAVHACLEKLKGRIREVFEARHVNGQSSGEIAERLKISLGAVSMALQRGRVSIRRCVEQQIGMEAGL